MAATASKKIRLNDEMAKYLLNSMNLYKEIKRQRDLFLFFVCFKHGG